MRCPYVLLFNLKYSLLILAYFNVDWRLKTMLIDWKCGNCRKWEALVARKSFQFSYSIDFITNVLYDLKDTSLYNSLLVQNEQQSRQELLILSYMYNVNVQCTYSTYMCVCVFVVCVDVCVDSRRRQQCVLVIYMLTPCSCQLHAFSLKLFISKWQFS